MKILLSYHYVANLDVAGYLGQFTNPPTVFLDSGAFSAYTQGVTIDLDAYCEFIDRWREHLWCYAALDAIGNAEVSQANWREMRRRGLDPLPVFHGGEPWEVLEEYCDACDYVALGGMVAKQPAVLYRWLVKCFQIGERYGTRFHGFGQTRWNLLRDIPFWTVDSSSWLQVAMFGTVKLFDVNRGRWVNAGSVGDQRLYRHGRLIREHGVDPADLADRDRYNSHVGALVGAMAWRRAEAWLQARHQVQPPASRKGVDLQVFNAVAGDLGSRVPDTAAKVDHPTGTGVFFADANITHYPPLEAARPSLFDTTGPGVFFANTGLGLYPPIDAAGPVVFLAGISGGTPTGGALLFDRTVDGGAS